MARMRSKSSKSSSGELPRRALERDAAAARPPRSRARPAARRRASRRCRRCRSRSRPRGRRSRTSWRMTPSAVGERQMFPRQTKSRRTAWKDDACDGPGTRGQGVRGHRREPGDRPGDGAQAVRRGRAGAVRRAQRRRASQRAADGCGGDWLAIDVTAPDAPDRVIATCAEQMGGIDVLVNNAGTSFARPLDELTDEDWHGQWDLHVMAPMRLMRCAAPRMAEAGGGRIVNVTSSAGKRPSLTNAAYWSPRRRSSRSAASSPTPTPSDGVLVNAVAPGPVSSRAVDRRGRPRRPDRRGPRASRARRRSQAQADEGPARPLRRARGDRRRRRLPVLGAREHGHRRRVVGRRRRRATSSCDRARPREPARRAAGFERTGHRVMLDRSYLEVGHEGEVAPLPAAGRHPRQRPACSRGEAEPYRGRDGEWLDVALAGPVSLTRADRPRGRGRPAAAAARAALEVVRRPRRRRRRCSIRSRRSAARPHGLVVDHAPGEPLRVTQVDRRRRANVL